MGALDYVHAGVNVLLGSWLCFQCVINPIQRRSFRSVLFSRFHPDIVGFATLSTAVMAFAAIIFTAALAISTKAAVLSSAFLFLVWALCAYYTLQRFADFIHKPVFVATEPLRLRVLISVALLSSLIAILRNASWPWLFLLPCIWLACGYCCAEIQIRRQMRFMTWDRNTAITMMNLDQGKMRYDAMTLATGRPRYPFP